MTTRRNFLQQSSAALAGFGIGRRGSDWGVPYDPAKAYTVDVIRRVDSDSVLKTLAMRALDAAKSAGATYADVRLTRILMRSEGAPSIDENYGFGVRALAGGYWGFAASPFWDAEEAAQLGRDAAAQAKTNAGGSVKPVELGKIPIVNGSWLMPVKIDPFTVPLEETKEFYYALNEQAKLFHRHSLGRERTQLNKLYYDFTREERAVATSEGSFFTQTLYRTNLEGEFGLKANASDLYGVPMIFRDGARGRIVAGAGWELVLEAAIADQFPQLLEECQAQRAIRRKPGDIGRYDVVFDATTMANLLHQTIGVPTQLDRALGLEANASGTSYLNDPLAMLGTEQVGASLLNVTADRSRPAGLATVKWDDEGVTPDEFTLVKDGVLHDYQTTREQAAWLAPYYQKAGIPIRSHGCAGADSALSVTTQQSPNLTMSAGIFDTDFMSLVADTKRGLAVTGGGGSADWQGRTITGAGALQEIVDGKLGATITGLTFMIRTSELWKNITAIGGPRSVLSIASLAAKGQPEQRHWLTVSAVPAKVKNVAFIDPSKKV